MTPALRLRAWPLLVLGLLCPTLATAQIVTGTGPGSNATVRVIDTDGTDRSFLAYPIGFGGGTTVALGDINGDGVRDIITGAGPSGGPHVRVWNGVDHTEIGGFFAYDPAFPGGVSVAAGDVNGDGQVDIITGAGPGGGPHVRVWDGATFAEIGGFYAYDPAFPGGVSVAAGDVNGDGRVDIITGAGPGGGPHVRVWSGADFTEIGGFFAYSPFFAGGVHVAAGDVNGDGLADIITGAGPGGGPHVRLWNGATFVEFGGFFAYDPSFPGGVKVAALDLTYDGRVEILTVPGPGAGPLVAIWTSDDFLLMGAYFAFDPAFTGGISIASPPASSGLRFTSATTTTFAVATPGTFTVTTVGGGAVPTLTVTGALPPGVTFTDNGDRTATLAGTPTGAGGTFPLTFTATSGSVTPVTQEFTLTITCPEITVTPGGALAGGTIATPYSQAFAAAGGTAPHTFSVSAGALPPTLTLGPTGVLSGTPTQAGTFNFTVTATDTLGCSGSVSATITISCPTITVTPTTVPDAIATVPYGPVTFSQTGAGAPVTWSISSGTPPAGITISPTTGVLSGTAGASGTFTFIVTAATAAGCTGSVSITLTVQTGPNQAPSFTVGANQTVLEDGPPQSVGGWATGISPGPPSEAGQSVAFNVTGNSNPSLFSVAPAVSPTGTLTYALAANATGLATITLVLQDSGGTAGGGVDTSAPQTFTITVTAVNDAPSFSVGPNQTVFENSGANTVNPWATAITAGPADEAGQTLTFNVTGNTNAALFSAGPAVSSTGTLTYTIASNTSGTATITLTLSDNGGIANGGINTSAPQTFTITVTSINSAPSFTKGPDETVLEDAGAQTVAPWATAIDPGGPDEATQIVTFNVTGNTNPALFSVAPAVSPTGTLTYTPAANASGTATITLTLSDDGGTAGGGVDTSAPQTFTITVAAVNDAPSFTPGANPTSAEDAGAQTVNPWATAISAGPADEAGQALAFAVTGNTNPALFSAAPAVSPAGVLTYTSAPNAFGNATITLVLQDNGGTANGGVNTSAPVIFTITITPVNDPPGLTVPLITYATAGNTQLHVAGATRPGLASIADAVSILTKSIPTDSDGPAAPAVVAFTGATTSGTATLNADGSFTYVPNAGFTGTDSFSFQVTDGATPVTGTIQVTVGPRVWYVSNQIGPNNAAGGDGRSTDAFDTLTAAETASAANDIIFVFNGDSQTTPLGGITLKNGQKLYGEGIGLTVAPFGTIVPAGTAPQLTSAGNTIAVLANTANGDRTDVEIRGLSLASTGGNAIDVTSADAATLGVRISENTITGATQEGIDINHGSSGPATLAVHDNTITATGTGIDITRTAGAVTITTFDDIVVSGASGGTGIIVTGPSVTFDATAGSSYQQVAGGMTAVGSLGDPVGGAGIILTNVSGDLAFTDLDIVTAAGAGLQVSGTGALNAGAGTGTGVAVAAGTGTMQSTGGPVVNITNATVDLPLASATVTSSATTGISLNTASGTVSSTLGSIGNTAGVAVDVTGGTVSLTYGGSVAQTNNVAMVSVSGGHTTGTITFSGTLNATNGPGLVFDNADSITTYNFTGTTTLNGGDAGIDIINGSSGTFSFGTGTTITNPSGTAFLLSGSNANVTYSGTISDNTGFAVDISGHAAGTVTFQTGSITSTGTGIQVANNTGGAINFNSPTIALTTGANKAVTLDVGNAGGTINFNPAGGAGLDISTTTGTGFSALGGGTITVQGSGNSIIAGAGLALEMVNVTVGGSGVNFGTTTSGFGARNVKLTSVTGGAVSLGTGALSGATSAAFLVGDGSGTANTGGMAAITYAGTITSTGGVRAVDIQDRPAGAGNITLSGTITHSTGNANVIFLDDNVAGTITFSGANSVLNGGTSTAVLLTDNTGATITFNGGGLDIDATSGGGFVATGGGTVSVTGTGNTIAATGGTALQVANTTIGTNHVTFQSISSGSAVSGTATGIILDTTGSSGGLHVTGTGSAGSGGTIRLKTGADGTTTGIGIYLNSTTGVQLAWMQLNDFDNFAIRGTNVQGFTMTNVVINGTNGTNDGFDEGAVSFANLTGSASVTNSSISGAVEHNMQVLNSGGTLNRLTVSGTTFGAMSTATGSDALLIESSGTAVMNVTADTNTFTSARGDHFQYSNTTAAEAGDVVFTNNTITNAHPAVVGGGGGIRVVGGNNSGQNGNITFSVSGNSIRGARGTALAVNKLGGTGTYSGTIANNVVGATGVQGSGSLEGSGIFVLTDGGGTYTASITGNTVRQYDNDGIFAQTGGSGVVGTGTMNVTVTGNTVTEPETQVAGALATNGFHLNGGTIPGDTYQICLQLSGNTLAGSGQDTIPAGSTFGDFRVRQRQSTTVRLPGYAGGAIDVAAVVAFLQGQNPGGESGVGASSSPPGGGFVGGAACPVPGS